MHFEQVSDGSGQQMNRHSFSKIDVDERLWRLSRALRVGVQCLMMSKVRAHKERTTVFGSWSLSRMTLRFDLFATQGAVLMHVNTCCSSVCDR